MRKIFLAAGHSISKPGASGNGYKEELLAIEFVDLLTKELKNLGINPVVDNHKNALTETIVYLKNLISPNSIVLEVHWNAGPANVSGTETLVPKSYTKFEWSLASELSETVSKVLNIKIRGVEGVKTEAESHHGSLGWMRLNGENVLMELCFISNILDMEKYQQNKIILAKEIATILKKYSII